MKPHSKKQKREVDTPGISDKKKQKKQWVREWQWKSKSDFNNYPKWFGDPKVYDEEWHQYSWGKHKHPDDILNSIKCDLRSSFSKGFVQGRNHRAKNIITGETVEFPNIENYYQ